MKQIFESDNISFVEVSELLAKDYLVMVNDVEHVVFDASFKDARPETTGKWFKDMVNLKTITGMKVIREIRLRSTSGRLLPKGRKNSLLKGNRENRQIVK